MARTGDTRVLIVGDDATVDDGQLSGGVPGDQILCSPTCFGCTVEVHQHFGGAEDDVMPAPARNARRDRAIPVEESHVGVSFLGSGVGGPGGR